MPAKGTFLHPLSFTGTTGGGPLQCFHKRLGKGEVATRRAGYEFPDLVAIKC